jgi:hypothetical protein
MSIDIDDDGGREETKTPKPDAGGRGGSRRPPSPWVDPKARPLVPTDATRERWAGMDAERLRRDSDRMRYVGSHRDPATLRRQGREAFRALAASTRPDPPSTPTSRGPAT